MTNKITVVPAPRPEHEDEDDNWQAVADLLDESRRRTFLQEGFVECDTCAAKPGSPTLCRGCLANRTLIAYLHS